MTILQRLSFPSLQSLCIVFVNRNHLVLDKFLARTPTLTLLVLKDNRQGISDEDIVTYFLDTHLHHIPSVYLTFRGAQKRVPKIIEEYPNARDTFPRMICWTTAVTDPERFRNFPFIRNELIGWDDNFNRHPSWSPLWQFRDGRVEFFSPDEQPC